VDKADKALVKDKADKADKAIKKVLRRRGLVKFSCKVKVDVP